MSDESPLARALRIAMQNHVTAYGGRNALDQGDYGYGTPVTYTEPNALSSSGLQHQGPWMREYMPSTLADVLSQILTYAPMAVPAMRGRVMENGLRPQDYATAPAMERGALSKHDYGPDIMGGAQKHGMNSEALVSMGGANMRQFKANTPQDMSAYIALPEEVQAWARQQPANMSDAAYLANRQKPGFFQDPYRDALIPQLNKNRRGRESERPFDVIPGGKE